MSQLTRSDLWSLEEYSERRPEFRAEVIQHKKHRFISCGENARLYFEDQMTVRYQVQEMLRIEKVFEAEGIQEELDAYNPMIPDGRNWKATLMMEYSDEQQRKQMLAQLIGIEDKVWMQVEGFEPVYAIADEDLDREDADKTSSVHFLRFELSPSMVAAAKKGAALYAGIEHSNYPVERIELNADTRNALVADLADVSLN